MIDNLLRSAIWNTYENKCFYCNRLIDWNELHIDHIIPEHLSENLHKLNKVKLDYNLGQDFAVNDLINLVPAHSFCNQRKSNKLFSKQTTAFYLELTTSKKGKLEREIEKIKNRKNKGQILSNVTSALANGLIGMSELKRILKLAEEKNWQIREIKLPRGIEFIDEIFDAFYLNQEYSSLYDKKLFGENDGIRLINDQGEQIVVSTLRQWDENRENGFLCKTNLDIKRASSFIYLGALLSALSRAKFPKTSFLSDPWISLNDLKYLSPLLIQDHEGKMERYAEQGLSIFDLVSQNIVKVNERDSYNISLEYDWFEISLREQFRADFNGDGIEEILVVGWFRATRGTLGYGFSDYLGRRSDNSLIESVSKKTVN